jgi:hypothetical protein
MNRYVAILGAALFVALSSASCGSASGGSGSGGGDSSTGGNVYFYCWDTGAANPHHYGHQTVGDHLCTKNELDDAGCNDDGPTAAGNEYWTC